MIEGPQQNGKLGVQHCQLHACLNVQFTCLLEYGMPLCSTGLVGVPSAHVTTPAAWRQQQLRWCSRIDCNTRLVALLHMCLRICPPVSLFVCPAEPAQPEDPVLTKLQETWAALQQDPDADFSTWTSLVSTAEKLVGGPCAGGSGGAG